MLFETFLRVGSTNYDGRLAKALKIEAAPGPNGNQPVPATGRGESGRGRGRGRGQVEWM